jgi:hypothetical protein
MILLPLGEDAAPPRLVAPERGGNAFGIDSVMLFGW